MADSSGTLASCAHFTRGGGAPAPDHDADHAARQSRVSAEQGRLLRWAKENQRLKVRHHPLPEFARGGEHLVFYRHSNQRYYKATLAERQKGYGIALGSFSRGATPAEYLDRQCLHNRIFYDDIRLEYVLENQGFPIIVISQPGVKGGSPSQAAIDALMDTKGFENIAPGAYYDENEGLLIFDLIPRNAILTEDGGVFPIDPVIQRIDVEFAAFLRAQPYTINLI
jgi:Serine/Threonine/Tyrosine Kinase found in polyvalent proteins